MDNLLLDEEEFDYEAYDLNEDEEEKLLNDDNSDKKQKDNQDDGGDDDDDDGEVLDINIGEDMIVIDSIPESSKKDKESIKSKDSVRNEKHNTNETNEDKNDHPKRFRRISPLRSLRYSRRPPQRYSERKSRSFNRNNYHNNNNRRNRQDRYAVDALLNFKPPPRYDNEESNRRYSNNVEIHPTTNGGIFIHNTDVFNPTMVMNQHLNFSQQEQQQPPLQPKIPNLLELDPIIPPHMESLNSLNQMRSTSKENLYNRPLQPPPFPPSISPLFLTHQRELNHNDLQQQQQQQPDQYRYQEDQEQYRYQEQEQYRYQEEEEQYRYQEEEEQCRYQDEQEQYRYQEEEEQQENYRSFIPNKPLFTKKQDNHNGKFAKRLDSTTTMENRWENSRLSPRHSTDENARMTSIHNEFEDDEEYRRKIEEQKRQRERVFKLKEERRLKALAQENQKLEQNNVKKTNLAETQTKILKTTQLRPNYTRNNYNNNNNKNNIDLTKSEDVGLKQFSVRNNRFEQNVGKVENSVSTNDNVFMSDRVIKRKDPLIKKTNVVKTTKSSNIIVTNSTQTITKKPSSLSKNYDDSNILVIDSNGNNSDNNISLFLNNRRIITKDQQMERIPLISISNLSVNTTKSRLLEIAQGIGNVQKIHHDPIERCATILFKDVAAAHLFYKQYQRYMLDLSVIDIRLVPRM